MEIPRILLVDDDFNSKNYVESLEEHGFFVEHATTPDIALQLSTNNGRYTLVIMECIMLPGETLANESVDDGMETGIVLFDKIKEIAPMTPCWFLTNARSVDLIMKMVDLVGIERVYRKYSTLPRRIIREIQETFSR